MRRSLVTRVGVAVAAFLVIQALLLVALGLFSVRRYGQSGRLRLVEHGVALARVAAMGGERQGGGCGGLETLTELDGFAVACYDARGRRLSRPRADAPADEALPAVALAEARRRGGAAVFVRGEAPGEPVAVIAALPDAVGGADDAPAFVGLFDVGTRTHVAKSLGAALVAQLVGVVSSTLLLTAWVTVRARRSLGRLEGTMHRIAEGGLEERLPVRGDDELARVGSSFNRMADALSSTIAALRASEAQRARMFAAFTHELATPLTSVLGYLESLRMPEIEADPQTRRRYLEVAHAQANALAGLSDDLAALSRLELEGLALRLAPTELAGLVRAEVCAFEARGAARGVRFEVAGPELLSASVDAQRVRQVLRNLLDNALRHAPEASTVRVTLDVEGGAAKLCIRDEGPGVGEDELPRLGEPLYRGDPSRSHHTGGRGLGLSIAVGIVRAHGGRLEFASPPGSGLAATVWLPLAAPRPAVPAEGAGPA
jgi:signal transduction histidine kinase